MAIELYKHQEEFVAFAEKMPYVFCGDDMGLGKTYEGIALDQIRRQQGGKGQKTLVVAPLSGVVDSWVRHFRKLTDLTVERVDNTSKASRLKFIDTIFDPAVDVCVLHWEALQPRLGLLDALQQQEWLHAIADEAHRAKNRKAQQTKALKSIQKVDYKTAMTGTPMKNMPTDAWSIIDWLFRRRADKQRMFGDEYYKLFTSYWNFYDRFIHFYEVDGYKVILGTKNEPLFRELIKPFYIARTKEEVLDLPSKYYSTRYVKLAPKQRKPYDGMKKNMLAWLGAQGDTPLVAPVVIAQMVRLQQMALAYCHVDDEGNVTELEKPSAKLDALVEIADEMGEQKLVVFSQYSKMIDLAHAELVAKGYKCAKLTGGTPQKARSPMIKEFQEGDTQIILCTIGAGGVGIDLYAASTAVFLDRAWAPADNRQAEDRIHRIGQTKPCQIIDIVAEDTVDRERGISINLKARWIKNLLEGREDADSE